MRIFRRRTRDDYRPATTTTTTDGRAGYAPAPPPDAYDRPPWHYGPRRGFETLLAAGVAGLLAYLATNIGDTSNSRYWAAYGILAAAGFLLALSQVLRGRPTFSPTVFLVAFVPTLVAVGWILLFHQPSSGFFRGHVVNWSGDIGIRGLVNDMGGTLLTLLAFGLGLVFGFCFDSARARRPVPPAREPVRQVKEPTPVDTDAADQPITRDRETVRS
jgi:hypothetical protein